MQILDNTILKDKYDVVVVGSGIGGLTAAALLAKRGIDVLVIEQHYLPGGACTSLRRQDFTFDVAVAMMFGFGQEGFSPHRFIMNELEEEIDIIPHECLYLMKIEDKELTFWRDFERYFEELVSIFPQQKKELRELYDYFYMLYENMILKNDIVVPPSELPAKENLKMLLNNPFGTLKILSIMNKNTEALVNKFITDPDVRAFFNMLTCTYCYCDSQETPAMLSGSLFCDNHEGGVYYPTGSPQMLSNKLEKVIERHGGHMLYRNLVDEILIKKGKAYGVRLKSGVEILADSVVSNGTVWNLYGKLVKPEHIKPKRMKWAHNFIPTFGSLVIYLGVDAEVIPEGTAPIIFLVEDMYNITGNDITIFLSSLDDPSLCPEGTHCLTIVQPSQEKWPRPGDPEYKSEKYQKQKKDETEKLLDQVEKQFPGLKDHIRVMEVGTPSTIERFTLKNWGAVGGPKMMMGQDMMKRLKARSDWKNLYLCGDSTVMGIGIPATTISGVGAANMVLRDLGMKEYLPRKFDKEFINYVEGQPWADSPSQSVSLNEESAKRIAKDCQHCETPECRIACPANIETPAFARRIEAGNFSGAARVLREVNPFSEICGYICPSEKFCERKCNRLEFDNRPVPIRELHKWVCGHVSNEEGWEPSELTGNSKKIAVIGAGPAGLTCAHYLARTGYRIDIYEKEQKQGGILTNAIPSSRLPENVIKREIEGLVHPNMNFIYGKTLGIDLSIADLEKEYDALFIAPGLGDGIKLDIPGINDENSIDALSFLKKCKNGNGNIGDKVLVIGGGSVASDTALMAIESGAAKVTLACLENEEEMPALKQEIEKLKVRGIDIKNSCGPKVCNNNLITFSACESVFDDKGTFNPCFDDSQTFDIEFDRVIMAIGQKTEKALAQCIEKELGMENLIDVADDSLQVKGKPGIYAGGDIIRGAGTVAEAVGDGRRAAMAINTMLKGKQE